MGDPIIRLTYDGGDATGHAIDMRLLGLSLQGADRITSDGLILLIHQRAPKRRERAPLIVKVREPQAGSWSVPAILQDAAWMLPYGYALAPDIVSGFLGQWWEAVKARFSGRQSDMQVATDAMLELNREHLASRDEQGALSHMREMEMPGMIRETMALQQRPLEQFVAPVGPSVGVARLEPGNAPPVSINIEEADEIRAMGVLAWGPISEVVLRTDGFRFHTGGLSIENPEHTGFLMARVHDPRFEEVENPYTDAASRRSEIVVLARSGYKNGELVKIDILDFVREIAA